MKTKAMKQMMMMTVVAIVALLPVRSVAASATLSIEDFTIKQGETKEMLIDVNNATMQVTMVELEQRSAPFTPCFRRHATGIEGLCPAFRS